MKAPLTAPPAKIRNIAELARLAGVHPGTVSRALGDGALVSPQTREMIRGLAAQHGFRPNQLARKLRVQRSGVIGVVVPLGHERRQHLSDPFFMTILGHLAEALTENGYEVMLSRIIPDADDWLERIIDSGMLDGVLLIGQSDQLATIEKVAARYPTMVVWGSHSDGQVHCSVGVDNRAGGRLAGEHLVQRGCRSLAFMGEVRTIELAERYRGLCEATQAAGLPQPFQLDTHLASDIMVAEITAHLDSAGAVIDGVAAASDVIAMRLLRVLADRGVRVPNDMAVTGFDDLPLAEQTAPALTTVRQDVVRGAKTMAEMLFSRIAGEETSSLVMLPELIVRGST